MDYVVCENDYKDTSTQSHDMSNLKFYHTHREDQGISFVSIFFIIFAYYYNCSSFDWSCDFGTRLSGHCRIFLL